MQPKLANLARASLHRLSSSSLWTLLQSSWMWFKSVLWVCQKDINVLNGGYHFFGNTLQVYLYVNL